MDDSAKKETLEEVKETEKKELTDEEAEEVAGGACFGFYDREKRRPRSSSGKRIT